MDVFKGFSILFILSNFFFIVQILYAKYCARLGVYKLPLGFVGHRLSGEPPQHGHCSITLVLDNKRVYIAVFQRGGGEGKPKEEGERISSDSDGS